MNRLSHPPEGAHAPGNSADPDSRETEDWSEGAASTPEAQAWLGCSRRTLWRLMDRGELPYRMVGHRRRIPIASLREILPEPAKPPNANSLGLSFADCESGRSGLDPECVR
jgi:excisionase family DNA binding protein